MIIGKGPQMEQLSKDDQVGTILPRILQASSPIELRKIIHQGFIRWFDEDAVSEENFSELAQEIWGTWI